MVYRALLTGAGSGTGHGIHTQRKKQGRPAQLRDFTQLEGKISVEAYAAELCVRSSIVDGLQVDASTQACSVMSGRSQSPYQPPNRGRTGQLARAASIALSQELGLPSLLHPTCQLFNANQYCMNCSTSGHTIDTCPKKVNTTSSSMPACCRQILQLE